MKNNLLQTCLKLGLSMGAAVALALSLQASAKPTFLKPLKEVYPDVDAKCTTCHVKGKELNPYGTKLSKEPELNTDLPSALKKAGKP